MSLLATDYLPWVTGPLLLVLTGGALLKRRLVPEFPVFFAYIVFHVFRSAVLFTVSTVALLSAALTVIPAAVPETLGICVSAAVSDCVPAVLNVALNVCMPLSPEVNV